MEYNHYTAERDEREHIETTQGPEIEKRKYETRWVSAGAGFGYLPNDTAGAYSGAAPGLYGLYLSGRYGGTWGMSPYTWGVGIIGGAGQGSRGFHVGGGVSVYPINDFFLQALYGTSVYSYVIPGYSDDWRYVSPKTVVEDGYTVLAGHDFHLRSIEVPGGHIMFSLACGATKVESQKWQPAYSVSVGYALQYWKN